MSEAGGVPYRKHPCAKCPFRRDTPPGQFPASRYEALQATVGDDDHPVLPGSPLFACHQTKEGKEEACAGWLAVCGQHHLSVRVAVIRGDLPPEALAAQPGWPELFGSYEETVAAQVGD